MTCRAVIADDVEGLRVLFRVFLEEAGVEVVGEAGSGREALALVEELSPDVLALDLSMPEMDGLEVLQALRERGGRTSVVVISGFSASRLAGAALELGAVEYVEKGRPPEDLVGAVFRACRIAQSAG